MKRFLLRVISSGSGISSKRTIGAISFVILTLAMVILAFVDPTFTGLCDILITLIITSASLLGITTFENIKAIKPGKSKERKRSDDDI